MRVGADTGGTFTDVVAADGRIAKMPSRPDDPAAAVRAGLDALDPDGPPPERLAHGTTVATNALLERRGAEVALVTTTGLADVIEIARQDRPSLYDQWADRPEPLVPRHRRHEVGGRLDEKHSLLMSLDRHRDVVLWKLDGLDDEQLRRPMTPSGTNLLGLVKHLAAVEYGWFCQTFGRETEPLPFDEDDEDADLRD